MSPERSGGEGGAAGKRAEQSDGAAAHRDTKGAAASAVGERVRLDKWLWAARFFKTRSLAAQEVTGGKVQLNGDHVKPAKPVKVGDVLRIRKGMFEHEITVIKLGARRGPPAQAQGLYEESEASKQAREELAERLRLEREHSLPPIPKFAKGRPTKRDRRQIDRFKGD
ncbi:RNA-binding S4 domain-containing protein [Haliangium ochraceum]|uniref:RNA-binding S4 domain protein n=1 Tax=Haliangium ochraceum (strain DSM 14365 / JCM 11303 / SMP-2) TaxID=502025 RepID=D0LZ35_HALO1|nr:RNA-binding S4 domain-containing protein [Haliangium ochraceum]ACY14505.1 RNA-binding S4 domain protein [Haliangium ochraceum DSM 14365]